MYDDYMIWVYNPVYNEAKRRDERLAQERYIADNNVNAYQQRLNRVETQLHNQASMDRQELDRRLAQESARLMGGLNSIDEGIRREIQRQNARLNEQMNAVRADVNRVNARADQVEQRINDLAEQFNSEMNRILEGIKDQKTRAVAYSNQLGLLLEQISALHPCKLTPGEYELLSEGLAFVEADIKNGDYQAAIGLSQTHIPTAVELKTRLEVLNDEFSQLVVQLHERCAGLYERIQVLRVPENNRQTIQYKEGDSVEFDGDIPFWSNGVFDAFADRFNQISNDVKDVYEQEMDIDSLRRSLGDMIKLDSSLNECVSFAHREYLEYISVCDLSERLHGILTRDNSWSLLDSGFADDDQRRSFSLLYDNGTGLEASIVVMPVRDTVSRNKDGSVNLSETRFSVSVFQPNGDNAELCDKTRSGILATFVEDGIDVGGNKAPQQGTAVTLEQFVNTAITAGDKIRNDRTRAAMTSIGL